MPSPTVSATITVVLTITKIYTSCLNIIYILCEHYSIGSVPDKVFGGRSLTTSAVAGSNNNIRVLRREGREIEGGGIC
jgi:hypothetical protein